jgi:hypothetical protein
MAHPLAVDDGGRKITYLHWQIVDSGFTLTSSPYLLRTARICRGVLDNSWNLAGAITDEGKPKSELAVSPITGLIMVRKQQIRSD